MDHESKTIHECETPVVQEGTVDRGLFEFMGKKEEEEEEKKQEEVMVVLPSSVGNAQSPARKKEEEEEGEKKQEEVMVEQSILPSSVRAAQSPAPASSDVVAIDQGIAYLLMFVALVLTYIIH